jgi:hypothetical protein
VNDSQVRRRHTTLLRTKTHHIQSQVLQKTAAIHITHLDLSPHTLEVSKEATGRLSELRVMARLAHPVTDLSELPEIAPSDLPVEDHLVHPATAPSAVQVADTLVAVAGVEENGVETNGPK